MRWPAILAAWLWVGVAFGGALCDAQTRAGQPVDFATNILCGVTVGPVILFVELFSGAADRFHKEWDGIVRREPRK